MAFCTVHLNQGARKAKTLTLARAVFSHIISRSFLRGMNQVSKFSKIKIDSRNDLKIFQSNSNPKLLFILSYKFNVKHCTQFVAADA